MIKERLSRLREKMAEKGVGLYMVTSSDFHNSEYVGDYFKERAFITGFTGSAGTAVITPEEAFLWTDGRYFIQAAAQLEGTSVQLMKMGQEGVPTVEEFILSRMESGMTLGFDGRTVPAATGLRYREKLEAKGAKVDASLDLVGEIWEDRPALPAEPVFLLEEKYAGQSRADKIANLRAAMAEAGAGYFALTVLDDIAWLLNIRGGDVAYNPVVLSYLLVRPHGIDLYANADAFPEAAVQALKDDGVVLRPYGEFYDDISSLPDGSRLLADRERVSFALYSCLPAGVALIDKENPTYLPKAIKNPTEVENEKAAHIKDGVAVTRFIYWLKHTLGKEPITEMSAARKLEEFRQMGKGTSARALRRSSPTAPTRRCATTPPRMKATSRSSRAASPSPTPAGSTMKARPTSPVPLPPGRLPMSRSTTTPSSSAPT